jgi:hypothetical protein
MFVPVGSVCHTSCADAGRAETRTVAAAASTSGGEYRILALSRIAAFFDRLLREPLAIGLYIDHRYGSTELKL